MKATPRFKMLAPLETKEHLRMSDLPKVKSSSHKRIAWAAGILCVVCCAAPIIGLAIGSASLAAFAFYFDKAVIALAVVGVALFVYKFASRRKAPACELNCGCRPTPDKDSDAKPD